MKLVYPTNNWSGPGGTDLQQGVKWSGLDHFVYQADAVPGGENLIIRRYNPDLTYKGYLTVLGGGHGTSCGVIQISPTVSKHLIPMGKRGIGIATYVVGGNASTRPVIIPADVGWCSALSVNNAINRVVVRKGGTRQTVNWYNRDQLLAGQAVKTAGEYSFATPAGATFQGLYNFGNSDFFSWEKDIYRKSKNYRCWIDQYTNGKKVHTFDITNLISRTGEPEGLMGYKGKLYCVKKVFGQHKHLEAVPIA